jgi:hypothetical protein
MSGTPEWLLVRWIYQLSYGDPDDEGRLGSAIELWPSSVGPPPVPQPTVARMYRRPGVDWRAKVDLFEQLRREHEFGVGTIAGVAAKFGVHRRVVRQALVNAVPAKHHYPSAPSRSLANRLPCGRGPDPGWAHRHDRRGDGDRTRPSAVEIMLEIEHTLATAEATLASAASCSAGG